MKLTIIPIAPYPDRKAFDAAPPVRDIATDTSPNRKNGKIKSSERESPVIGAPLLSATSLMMKSVKKAARPRSNRLHALAYPPGLRARATPNTQRTVIRMRFSERVRPSDTFLGPCRNRSSQPLSVRG